MGFKSFRALLTHSANFFMQKLFDNVLTLTTDTNLLLKSFKDCHDTSCSNFEEVAAMSTLLEKFVSRFSESKVKFSSKLFHRGGADLSYLHLMWLYQININHGISLGLNQ